MNKSKQLFLIFIITVICGELKGQVVYEPTYHSVYSYISRLAQKGILDLDDVVLPLSKELIYNKLDEASKHISELTVLEREELAFYLKEYTLWWRETQNQVLRDLIQVF